MEMRHINRSALLSKKAGRPSPRLRGNRVFYVCASDSVPCECYATKDRREAFKIARYFAQNVGITGDVTIDRREHAGELGFIDGPQYPHVFRQEVNCRPEFFVSTAVFERWQEVVKGQGMEENDAITALMIQFIKSREDLKLDLKGEYSNV
jgi:hypothetical protein